MLNTNNICIKRPTNYDDVRPVKYPEGHLFYYCAVIFAKSPNIYNIRHWAVHVLLIERSMEYLSDPIWDVTPAQADDKRVEVIRGLSGPGSYVKNLFKLEGQPTGSIIHIILTRMSYIQVV